MHRMLSSGLAVLMISASAARAQDEENPAVAAARVKEVIVATAAAESPRQDRVVALHAWVRDQVKQIRTSYG